MLEQNDKLNESSDSDEEDALLGKMKKAVGFESDTADAAGLFLSQPVRNKLLETRYQRAPASLVLHHRGYSMLSPVFFAYEGEERGFKYEFISFRNLPQTAQENLKIITNKNSSCIRIIFYPTHAYQKGLRRIIHINDHPEKKVKNIVSRSNKFFKNLNIDIEESEEKVNERIAAPQSNIAGDAISIEIFKIAKEVMQADYASQTQRTCDLLEKIFKDSGLEIKQTLMLDEIYFKLSPFFKKIVYADMLFNVRNIFSMNAANQRNHMGEFVQYLEVLLEKTLEHYLSIPVAQQDQNKIKKTQEGQRALSEIKLLRAKKKEDALGDFVVWLLDHDLLGDVVCLEVEGRILANTLDLTLYVNKKKTPQIDFMGTVLKFGSDSYPFNLYLNANVDDFEAVRIGDITLHFFKNATSFWQNAVCAVSKLYFGLTQQGLPEIFQESAVQPVRIREITASRTILVKDNSWLETLVKLHKTVQNILTKKKSDEELVLPRAETAVMEDNPFAEMDSSIFLVKYFYTVLSSSQVLPNTNYKIEDPVAFKGEVQRTLSRQNTENFDLIALGMQPENNTMHTVEMQVDREKAENLKELTTFIEQEKENLLNGDFKKVLRGYRSDPPQTPARLTAKESGKGNPPPTPKKNFHDRGQSSSGKGRRLNFFTAAREEEIPLLSGDQKKDDISLAIQERFIDLSDMPVHKKPAQSCRKSIERYSKLIIALALITGAITLILILYRLQKSGIPQKNDQAANALSFWNRQNHDTTHLKHPADSPIP